MKGVDNSVPFFITRNAPPCWATKILPSGAKVNTVGDEIEPPTCTREKPAGKVWASE